MGCGVSKARQEGHNSQPKTPSPEPNENIRPLTKDEKKVVAQLEKHSQKSQQLQSSVKELQQVRVKQEKVDDLLAIAMAALEK